MATTSHDQSILDALDELVELRPFPATASQLIGACRNEDVTAQQIATIIAVDSALTVKTLQIANSPIYGHSGQISSVQHATVVLGLRALRNLAIATAVGDVFGRGDHSTARTREQLWQHSLACGSVSRTVASVTGLCHPDEAFLAGVVHDVGKLFFTDHCPDQYMKLLENPDSAARVATEVEHFGVAHTYVGGECSRTWGLPDEVSDVICFHHQPDESDFESNLLNIVAASNQLTQIWDVPDQVGTTDNSQTVLKLISVDLSPDEIESLKERSIAELAILRDIHKSS